MSNAVTSVANVVLVTTGGQFERLISPSSPRLFSCKVLHNAEHVPADRAHLGWHPKLLKGILESDGFDRFMNQVLQTVASADSAGALINLSRTSDRHRSVGFGFAMFHLLRSRGYLVELIHWFPLVGNGMRRSKCLLSGHSGFLPCSSSSGSESGEISCWPSRSSVSTSFCSEFSIRPIYFETFEPTCQGDGFAKGTSFSTTSIQDFETEQPRR